jgi:uncharacterized membrane-anchored protein YhcB (DUF1043 family)
VSLIDWYVANYCFVSKLHNSYMCVRVHSTKEVKQLWTEEQDDELRALFEEYQQETRGGMPNAGGKLLTLLLG